MDKDIVQYEIKKHNLKKYIRNLDKECKKHFGPNNVYEYPVSNPYKKYYDVDDYKKHVIKDISERVHIQRNCKFISGVSSETDKENRFYTKIHSKLECDKVDGTWDPESMNRINKFENGVCWVNPKDQVCASNYDQSLLKPYLSRYKNMSEKIIEQSDKCNKTPGCKWKQMTKHTYDCVQGTPDAPNQVKKEEGPVMNPPKNMPIHNLEKFLETWYKSDEAPETSELIGKGNRCKHAKEEEASVKPTGPVFDKYINYRKLDPNDKEDAAAIKLICRTDENFRILKKEWNQKIKKKDGFLEKFYNFVDAMQFEKDIELSPKIKKSVVKKGVYPSIPQSIANMVMKSVAQNNADKRGMLAWHSTGSGKCHAINTPILMFDGSIKLVQNIIVGDVIMGDDSTARNVLSLGTGEDYMYDIIPSLGEKYTVNSEHILCLYNSRGKQINIEVNDFLKLPIQYQKLYKGYKTAVIFAAHITSSDPYTTAYNDFVDSIPSQFLINSQTIRINTLAGIIDKYAVILDNAYIINVIENSTFAKDILFLARSLGFNSYISKNTLYIIGILSLIPTRIHKNKIDTKNALLMDFTVNNIGKGTYYGFTLDKNHKYLMGDFTVTHNTCTAAGVMDSFWDTDRPIIFASSIDAIASNPDYKFHECAYNFFPRFKQGQFKGRNQAESMALIAASFKKRNIKFLTFAKLSNRVMKANQYKKEHGSKQQAILQTEPYVDLENAVLIIDEVHNLFRPLANQQKEHARLEAELVDPNKYPNLKVIILTATPGDNIPDIIKLLNIIRDPKSPLITAPNIDNQNELTDFKIKIRGIISYFDMSGDDTKFPIVKDNQNFIKAPMSYAQFEKYVETYKSVKESQKNFKSLSKSNQISKYWEPARKYANMLFNFEKDMNLNDFSAKLPYLLENIEKYPDQKQYVYSAFYTKMGYGGQGIIAIAKELEKRGYKKLRVSEAKKLNKSGKLPEKGVKRYILAISTELGEESGDAGTNLHELVNIYNHPENRNGELIHVMLASQKYNESIDLRAVRKIHLFEPLVSMASDIQALGRARRYCSHTDLPKEDWDVSILRYMSENPLPVLINNQPEKQKLNQEIIELEELISESSSKEIKKEIKKNEKLLKKKKIDPSEIEIINKDIAVLEEKLKNLIDNSGLKLKLKEKQKALKKLDKPPKFFPGDIENIEERIFKESRERMKELFTMYQCMREAAIDCRILNPFHAYTGSEIKCENYINDNK